MKACVASLSGMKLGEYVVHELLGEGGMSDVYSGVQPVIGKKVAIKVLKPETASDQSQVQRLMTEAVAVNAIGHRNIIDIFGSGTLPDGRAYVVMEFLEGEGLDVYLHRHGSLPQLETVELLIDICAPLAAAHAKGFIHRDLKPSNVFLVNPPDGTRFLKLLDFGLAKRSVSLDGRTKQTSVHRIAGTPDYMAPEQASAQDVSPLTDLYALGVLAYQLLSGKLPFSGLTPMEVMMQHVSAPPPKLRDSVPQLRPELEQLIDQLLEKEPARRPPTAEVVRAELKHIGLALRNEGAVAHRVWTGEQPAVTPGPALLDEPGALERPVEVAPAPAVVPATPARSRRTLVIGGGIGVAALVALTVVVAGRVSTPKAAAIVVAPPPAEPVAAPAPAPVAPDVAAPPVASAETNEAAPVKSQSELRQRVSHLAKRLREVPAKERGAARKVLGQQQRRLGAPVDERERRDIDAALDAFESTYLAH